MNETTEIQKPLIEFKDERRRFIIKVVLYIVFTFIITLGGLSLFTYLLFLGLGGFN